MQLLFQRDCRNFISFIISVCGFGWVATVKVIGIVILGMMIEICNKYYEYDKCHVPCLQYKVIWLFTNIYVYILSVKSSCQALLAVVCIAYSLSVIQCMVLYCQCLASYH